MNASTPERKALRSADAIAADFAEIPFENHEAKTLALAYIELKGANQWLRDDVALKAETIAAAGWPVRVEEPAGEPEPDEDLYREHTEHRIAEMSGARPVPVGDGEASASGRGDVLTVQDVLAAWAAKADGWASYREKLLQRAWDYRRASRNAVEGALSPPVGDETEALRRARGEAELEGLAAELERWAVNRERCHLDAKLLRKAARALLRGDPTAATRRPSSSLPRERPPDEMAVASEDLAARVIAGTATRADVEWLAESNEHLMARVAGLEAREARLRRAALHSELEWQTAYNETRESMRQAHAALDALNAGRYAEALRIADIRGDLGAALADSGEAFPDRTLRLAQALRLLRDTGGEYAFNVATRALAEACIDDPPDSGEAGS